MFLKEGSKYYGVTESTLRKCAKRGCKKYQFRMVDGHGGVGKVYQVWVASTSSATEGHPYDEEVEEKLDDKQDDRLDKGRSSGCESQKIAESEQYRRENRSISEIGRRDEVVELVQDANQRREFEKITKPININVETQKESKVPQKISNPIPQEINSESTIKEYELARLRSEVCFMASKRSVGVTIEIFIESLGVKFNALEVTKDKLKRWMIKHKKALKGGVDSVEALRDNRGRPSGCASLREEHTEMIIGYLLRRDIKPNNISIYKNLCMVFDDMPSLATVERWIKRWKTDNRLVYEIAKNPDKSKSHFLPAFGNASESYVRVNAGWELDATPADVLCSDGKRWQIYGLIDIYSRMAVVTMEKKTSAYGVSRNLRAGFLKLGLPEIIITDNGRDYKNNHVDDICLRLGIAKREVQPYSGQKKPHVERFFGTLTRSLFQQIKGYVGHNISERQELVAQRTLEKRHEAIKLWHSKKYGEESFSKALMNRENAELFVELPVSSDELREFISKWLIEYENSLHGNTKMTPKDMYKSDRGTVRTVGDERMLDLMLGVSLVRSVSKKGIKMRVEGIDFQYSASKLVPHIGTKVKVIVDDSLDRIYVYELDSGVFICEAMDFAVNPDAKRSIIKEAHAEYKKHEAKAKKLIRDAESKREEVDEAVSKIWSSKIDKLKEVDKKDVSLPKESIVSKDEIETNKKPVVAGYTGLVDRFYQKMRDGTWNEKDEKLKKANMQLYEIAIAKLEHEDKKTG